MEAAVSEEGQIDSLLEHEITHHYWFLEKCNSFSFCQHLMKNSTHVFNGSFTITSDFLNSTLLMPFNDKNRTNILNNRIKSFFRKHSQGLLKELQILSSSLNEWLILTTNQIVWGYFISGNWGLAYFVFLYQYLLCVFSVHDYIILSAPM